MAVLARFPQVLAKPIYIPTLLIMQIARWTPSSMTSSRWTRSMAVLMALNAVVASLSAQTVPIAVPNGSFESQSAFNPNGVSLNVDSWTKLPNPGDSTSFQFFGNFFNAPNSPGNTIDNVDGAQAAYALNIPGTGVQQLLSSSDGVFQVGVSYTLTVGLTANSLVTSSDAFSIGLYYLDGTTQTTVAETIVPGGFPNKTHLIDSSVILPAVQAGDAWAGKAIGIQLFVSSGSGSAYWDLDNVRLTSTTVVPEPSTWALAALGLGGLFLAPRFLRARC
jgi:PEP-CTERM motif